MSVRPLDVVLTVQRTPELKSNHANENTRAEAVMQQSSDAIKKDVQLQEQSVVQTNKTEGNTVNRDGRGNSGYGGGKGKKKGQGKGAKPEENQRKGIDISI